MKDEIDRRATLTTAVLQFFQQHPLEWIDARQLAEIGGFCAWRSRVSDARKQFMKEGGDIVWNREPRHSCYRYHPQAAQGRDSGTQVPREWSSDGPFTRSEPAPSLGQQILRFHQQMLTDVANQVGMDNGTRAELRAIKMPVLDRR